MYSCITGSTMFPAGRIGHQCAKTRSTMSAPHKSGREKWTARRSANSHDADGRHDQDDEQRLDESGDEEAPHALRFGGRQPDLVAIDAFVWWDRPIGEIGPPFVRAHRRRGDASVDGRND